MGTRTGALVTRLEQGAQMLATFAERLSNKDWQTVCSDDGRTVGVLVHHVASALIPESDIIKQLASGTALTGVTWAMVDQGNADHASAHGSSSQQEAAELLRHNGAIAARVVRGLSDDQLDLVAPNSLHADAPVTTQFWIENHPLAHAYRHLASIRAALSVL